LQHIHSCSFNLVFIDITQQNFLKLLNKRFCPIAGLPSANRLGVECDDGMMSFVVTGQEKLIGFYRLFYF